MEASKIINEMMFDEFNEREKKLLENIKRNQAKVKRNSFLEPFDTRAYADERIGIPVGASRINGIGRCKFGTSRQTHLEKVRKKKEV